MSTKVYGASDDLVEFEGDVSGEVGHYTRDSDQDRGALVACSDGTLLSVKYGKPTGGIWNITVVREGDLFAGIEVCTDEDANPHSDVAMFRDGLKWALAANDWDRVR